MKIISIYGDSNGAGSWDVMPSTTNIKYGKITSKILDYSGIEQEKRIYKIAHPGLPKYFAEDDIFSINYSHGGGNNHRNIIDVLDTFYFGGTGAARLSKCDAIIFFITDPLRDLIYHGKEETRILNLFFSEWFNSLEEISSFLLKRNLDILQEVSNITGIPVITVDTWGKIKNSNTKYNFLYSETNWWESFIDVPIPIVTDVKLFEVLDNLNLDSSLWNAQIKDKLVEEQLNLYQYLDDIENRHLFPDSSHLYGEGYLSLANKLIPIIKNL